MPAEKKIIVSCPTCKKTVIWNEQAFRPFCSERCKLIDLGEWAAEEKIIPGESIDAESDYDSFLHSDTMN
jgi:endogenous inhibitor of DNA gyrase (YacG/DUF329 family)